MGCAFSQEQKNQSQFATTHRKRLSIIDCRKRSTKVMDIIVENVQIIAETLTKDQTQYCVQCLSEHPLFNGLSQQELAALCNEMVWVKAKKNEYLFKQGESGHSFFIIEKGEVSIQVDGKKITELREKQYFGEMALLFRASRAASVQCIGDQNRYFVMKPALYRTILQQLKEVEYSRNKEIIEKIGLFQCLTNKQKYALTNAIKQVNFQAGDIIFQAGEVSQGIYIISDGSVQISLTGKQPILLRQLQVFGQSALRQNGRRLGKAQCIQNTKCLVIGKKDIEKALGSKIKNLFYYNLQKWALLRAECFKQYDNAQLNKIILGFQCIQLLDGQKILSTKYRGLIIGLQGGLNNHPQGILYNIENWTSRNWNIQTLIKNGNGCVGYLAFQKLTEILNQIQNKKKLMRASQKCIGERDDNLNITDFQFVKKLGEGQFGQVFLVKNTKTSGGLFAIKCLLKKAIRQEQMENSVIQQKKILQKAIFPYIVGFVKAFHDKENIFLLMQYIEGKQMFEVIRQMPTLSKPIARYYFGCILLSIEYLHANNIIYRDIKPENCIINKQGKALLIDMGTAKELNSKNMFKTYTIIGTPHYMAPQVFQGKGYTFQADYWSLGILLYQFVCGRLPFGQQIHDDPYTLYSIIKKGKIEFPKALVDDKVKKLINFILVKDPKLRSQQVNFEKIKMQEYFEHFTWTDLLQEMILPPYIPNDFRNGKSQLNQSTKENFLKQLYRSKNFGKVQSWNQDIEF